MVTIGHENGAAILTYEVLDLMGRRVLQGQPNSSTFEVDLGTLPAGTYILRSEVDTEIISTRLIKQRS